MEDESKQVELPEPINIIIENYTDCDDLIIIGSKIFRTDGLLTIKIDVGKPGQNLRLVGKQADEHLRPANPGS